MRFSRVRLGVTSALAALGAICLTVSSVQAFDQPPQKIPADVQSNPVELTLELGAAPASPEANSSKLVLRTDAARRTMSSGPPANDDCADFIDIFDGVTDYDTTGATTDGPTHPECDTAGDGGVTVNDIWYRYVASCSGPLTLSTCNENGGDTSYDSDLVIYDGTACADLSMLGCNDDAAGVCTASGTTFASTLIVDVVEGNEYLVRVGGWANPGDAGPGSISIFCAPCGDGICDSVVGEDCSTCPEDCTNGVCDGDENCGTCPGDCGECPCHNESTGNCDSGQIGLSAAHAEQCYMTDCWEIDGDGVCDPEEDRDGDGICDMTDCAWTGLAFPFDTRGEVIDTVSFQVNTNRAGGDIFITGDAGCQPDVNNILATLCCAVSGLEPGVPHDVHFDPLPTSIDEPTWILFLQRSGNSGTDPLGFPNGSNFPGYEVARNTEDPSLPNRAFVNLSGTGNPGDWTDLHLLGSGLGNPYCVDLSFAGQDTGGPYDCIANPEPTGACCNVDGDECQMMRGFECGAAGGVYLGDGTTCEDCITACNADAGTCCESNGTPGCDDPMCCHFVCLQDPFCCGAEAGDWDAACANAANDPELGCGQTGEACEPGGCVDEAAASVPECIQTGPNLEQDGALGMVLDEYGAFASGGWSGGNEQCGFGDMFNPDGPFPAFEAAFGSALFFYKADTKQRAILSAVPNHQNTYPIEFSAFTDIPASGTNVASDTNGDGVNDTLASGFAVCGPNELNLQFEVVQSVEQVAPAGGGAVSVLTQAYTITNVSDTAIDFVLVRHDDYDMGWVGGNADDSVGTMTNGHPLWDRHVYQLEDGQPETAITLSSPQGDIYIGLKGGVDPDGPGPAPPFGCGTDFLLWDEYGIPEFWANYIANVGYDTDGESGPDIPGGCGGGCSCDASIVLSIPVSLEPAETTCVCVVHTYGQRTPVMGTCPEGCAGECGPCPTDVDGDGDTDASDLAALLGAWGPVTPNSVCLNADQNGDVEASDLATLLGAWGDCP